MLIDEIKNIVSTEREARKFGVQIGIVLILIGLVLLILHRNSAQYFLIVSMLLIILGIIFPKILIIPNKIWMSFGVILGFFTSRLILYLLFYLVITPIGFIAKIMGKDFLDEKIEKNRKSYWNIRSKETYNKSQTEKQF